LFVEPTRRSAGSAAKMQLKIIRQQKQRKTNNAASSFLPITALSIQWFGYGLKEWRIMVRFPSGVKICLFSKPSSYSMGFDALSRGYSGQCVNLTTHLQLAEAKNAWSCTSKPHMHSYCGSVNFIRPSYSVN
jgi:hypothetical protein